MSVNIDDDGGGGGGGGGSVGGVGDGGVSNALAVYFTGNYICIHIYIMYLSKILPSKIYSKKFLNII